MLPERLTMVVEVPTQLLEPVEVVEAALAAVPTEATPLAQQPVLVVRAAAETAARVEAVRVTDMTQQDWPAAAAAAEATTAQTALAATGMRARFKYLIRAPLI